MKNLLFFFPILLSIIILFTSLIALFPESNGLFIALSNAEGQRTMLDQMMETFAIQEFKD